MLVAAVEGTEIGDATTMGTEGALKQDLRSPQPEHGPNKPKKLPAKEQEHDKKELVKWV